MKYFDSIAALIGKYKLNHRTSFITRMRINHSMRKTHSRILRNENPELSSVNIAVAFRYAFSRLGFNFSMTKSARIAYGSFALIFCVSAAAVLLTVLPNLNENESAQMLMSDGAVNIMRSGTLLKASDLTDLKNADIIETGDKSSVVIRSSGHQIALLQNSQCSINSADGKTVTNLINGQIYFNTASLMGSGCDVVTPNASVSVRGTLFSIKYTSGKTEVAVREGSVSVKYILSGEEKLIGSGSSASITDAIVLSDISKSENAMLEEFGKIRITPKGLIDNEERKRIHQLNEKSNYDEASNLLNLDQIKERYGRVEQMTLFDGKIFIGATISRAENVRFITTGGVVVVPARKIQGLKTIR